MCQTLHSDPACAVHFRSAALAQTGERLLIYWPTQDIRWLSVQSMCDKATGLLAGETMEQPFQTWKKDKNKYSLLSDLLMASDLLLDGP